MAGTTVWALLVSAAAFLAGAVGGGTDEHLYGRVTTTDGERLEGYLRWDRNEGTRSDFLDASKEIPPGILREAERLDPAFAEEMRRRRSIVAFGVRIVWEEDDLAGPPRSESAIRFAHIASLEPLGPERARIVLTDGQEIELVASSSDLGARMRDVIVETSVGDVEVDWDDIGMVELLEPPADAPGPSDPRLHGTVVTRGGHELVGWITWDLDEAFASDVLDGEEGATDYEIPFGEIDRIAPEDRRSARVVLRSGVVRVLRGTNDVDRTNRGIEVSDPSLGRALVAWEGLQEVRFHPPGPGTGSAARDPSLGPLRGTVFARDGRVLQGEIRWGHDEERGWEILDGRAGDTRLDIELGRVRSVEPDGEDAALVELFDGRRFRLEGTEDVGAAHRGVFVKAEGRSRRLVRWVDVERVVFER